MKKPDEKLMTAQMKALYLLGTRLDLLDWCGSTGVYQNSGDTARATLPYDLGREQAFAVRDVDGQGWSVTVKPADWYSRKDG